MNKGKFYRRWTWIQDVTRNRNSADYHRYGGRGIQCYWAPSEYRQFEEYIQENLGDPQGKKFLHRIDTDKGFEPGNLVWADGRQMSMCKPNTRQLKYRNQVKNAKDWAEEYNVSYWTMLFKLAQGMPLKDIIKKYARS